MRIKYLKYIQGQSSVNIEIEGLKQDEHLKASRAGEETIDIRIIDVEKALRSQLTQNKMLKNQYEKLRNQLETLTKKNIQAILF